MNIYIYMYICICIYVFYCCCQLVGSGFGCVNDSVEVTDVGEENVAPSLERRLQQDALLANFIQQCLGIDTSPSPNKN